MNGARQRRLDPLAARQWSAAPQRWQHAKRLPSLVQCVSATYGIRLWIWLSICEAFRWAFGPIAPDISASPCKPDR